MQGEQLDAGCDLRRLREQVRDVLGTDRLDVSQTAVAEMCQRLLRDRRVDGIHFSHLAVSHGPRLLSLNARRGRVLFSRMRHSCSLIEIVFTIRSACGLSLIHISEPTRPY